MDKLKQGITGVSIGEVKAEKAVTDISRRPPTTRMVQNFHLVWLDGHINDVNNDDCRNSITKLRQIVNTINTFTDVDECIDFITDINQQMAYMIIPTEVSQMLVPVTQEISQISSIFIFCENNAQYAQWAKEYSKVKGTFTHISSIYEALKQAVQQSDHNSIPLTFVKPTDRTSKQNLDTLDQSFMYTQILKEILLTIDFEQSHTNDFLTYCQEQFVDNVTQLANVTKIKEEYHHHQPTWWYTSDSFLYSMLNKALRLMEVDLIVKMGFFVRDLHNHIATLHAEQFSGQTYSDSFTVYRGQGLSQTDFDQLKNTEGGLISFNNFLSTSLDRAVSFAFAESNQYNANSIGVLFEIHINPSISSSPFANIGNVSAYRTEEEILFSTHSVFRIGQLTQINANNRLWEANLTLTSDDDPQLHELTKSMQEETSGRTGWHRLGRLMLKLGHFNRAEESCEILLKQAKDEGEKAHLFNQLGLTKYNQGEYAEAIKYYEKHLEISQKTLPANHPSLATSYNNIGGVYSNMGEYSKALSYYEKAFEIRQKTLPANHPSLATSYNNIGEVYYNMGEYSKALSYYEKALEIQQKSLPGNHPSSATSYNNIGLVYSKMGEYSKALSYYGKDLQISQKTLPANHPDLATSYNNIGLVYSKMGEYSKALSYYEKAVEISQKTLPSNHPSLATSYNNIGGVYYNMGEYSKALSYYEKDVEISQKTLPANHPSLATSFNNIGLMYSKMGEYSKALSYFERALDIKQHSLPSNHPSIQSVKESIETLKKRL